jgi:hypothetical protein
MNDTKTPKADALRRMREEKAARFDAKVKAIKTETAKPVSEKPQQKQRQR